MPSVGLLVECSKVGRTGTPQILQSIVAKGSENLIDLVPFAMSLLAGHNTVICLEQSLNVSCIIDVDIVRRRGSWQSGHGHDLAAQYYDKFCTGR